MRDDRLMDVDLEPMGVAPGVDLVRRPGNLCLALPGGELTGGRIFGRAVDGAPRVAEQVQRLDRARHGSDLEPAVDELDLRPADPRRAIAAERGHRKVLARRHQRSYAPGELRRRHFELGPRSDGTDFELRPLSFEGMRIGPGGHTALT